MILFKRIPDVLRERFDSWRNAREIWLARAKKAKEYYYQDVDKTGTNYTAEQVQNIENTTGIPVSINIIYPIVNQKLAMLVQSRPSIKVVSTDGRFKDEAFVLDKMKHGIFLQSNSITEIEEMTKESLLTGIGLITTREADFYRPGQFNTLVKHVPNELCILDPNSGDKSLEEMEGYFLEQEVTLAKARHLYDDIVSQLTDEAGNPVSWAVFTSDSDNGMIDENYRVVVDGYSVREKVVARKYHEKIFSTMYLVEDEKGDIQRVFEENLDAEVAATILPVALKAIPGVYVRESLMLGDFLVDITTRPITNYELKSSFFEWGGRPYRSYGMVHFTVGMQEAYDKMVQMFILNGILTNNAGWIAPKGSIAPEDKHKWEKLANNPQIIKEYIPKEVGGKLVVPTREKVEPLSSFYPVIMDMLENQVKKSTGITDVLVGDTSETGIEAFSTLQQYQSSAMQRVILSTQHINQTLTALGDVLVEIMVANISPNSNYVFFDENGLLNEIVASQEVVRSIKLGSYGVTSIPSTNIPTKKMAISIALMGVAQSSSDPVTRQLYTQKALELAEIGDTEGMQESADIVRRSQAELETSQEDNQRLRELTKQMENKMINVEIENRILKKVQQASERIAKEEGKTLAETKLGSPNLANS